MTSRLLCIIRRLLRFIRANNFCDNRYFRSGAVVAMLAVSMASWIWSLVVLCEKDALTTTSYFNIPSVVRIEDGIAGAMISLSTAQIFWLWRHLKPWPFQLWSVGYVIQTGWWFALLMLVFLDTGSLRPGAVAWLGTGVILSAFAFTALPRGRDDD